MNKKLMAFVATGVLVAPAAVFAQGSTVQMYGLMNMEYGFARGVEKAGGGKTNSWDGLNSQASYIGFKGEEKLAGAMSAFFQCETDLGFLKGDAAATVASTATQGGWCSRNSAVGLKSDLGSLYVGTWDSPTKRAVASSRILSEVGWNGVQTLLVSASGAFVGAFSSRNANSINYDSPKFGDFSVSLQTTSTKQAAATTASGMKGRSNSMSLNYAGGPLTAVVSFLQLDDNRAVSNMDGAKDTALVLGGTYTFGPAKVGVVYADGKVKSPLGMELQRRSWNIAGIYDLAGPHSVYAGYTVAGDAKFSGPGAAPAQTGSDTGAHQYSIGYNYSLSKRTTATLSYLYLKNDDQGANYSVGTNHLGAGMALGSSSSAFVTRLQHAF